MVAAGVVLRRYRILDGGFIDAANSLVYYILLPALLFHEIGGTDFRQAFSGPLVAGGYAATLATFLLAFLASRALGLGPSEAGTFVQGSFRANLAYVGLPIVFNAVGPAGLRKAGIFLGLIVPLLNGLSIVALMTPHGAGKGAVAPRPPAGQGRRPPAGRQGLPRTRPGSPLTSGREHPGLTS